MKKLSIQEKAEAYDKAKARMMKAFRDNRCSLYFMREIFSEPEKDKDERTRKELLEHCINRRDGKQVCVDASDYRRWADWLKKQGKQTSPQTNEHAWLYLVADVLTWKDGIGQYLDDPRVQELAKKLQREYAQKLYNAEWSEKAKAYDEALEKARKINSGEGVAAPPNWTLCEVLFPVLKEDKDERIRRMLCEIMRQWKNGHQAWCSDNKKIDAILAWLEQPVSQSKWEPSNKQIEALQYVYQHFTPPLFDRRGWDSLKTLELMCWDLKKLRKE